MQEERIKQNETKLSNQASLIRTMKEGLRRKDELRQDDIQERYTLGSLLEHSLDLPACSEYSLTPSSNLALAREPRK